jgi:hypothetical protein
LLFILTERHAQAPSHSHISQGGGPWPPYKTIDTCPRFLAVNLEQQLIPATSVHALNPCHSDVSTTMTYTHVLTRRGHRGVSPMDRLQAGGGTSPDSSAALVALQHRAGAVRALTPGAFLPHNRR